MCHSNRNIASFWAPNARILNRLLLGEKLARWTVMLIIVHYLSLFQLILPVESKLVFRSFAALSGSICAPERHRIPSLASACRIDWLGRSVAMVSTLLTVLAAVFLGVTRRSCALNDLKKVARWARNVKLFFLLSFRIFLVFILLDWVLLKGINLFLNGCRSVLLSLLHLHCRI